MSRVVSHTDLDRKLTTGEHKTITAGNGLNSSVAIIDELAWTMDPFAPVPKEFRTYGEGVNAELDRVKEIQEMIYTQSEENTKMEITA